MPTLDDLLANTMLFTGIKGAHRKPLAAVPGKPFHSPKPDPTPLKDTRRDDRETLVLGNPIWRFKWDPTLPGKFTNITIKTRGMGMDYRMAAGVFDRVEFRNCQIVRINGEKHELLLGPDFMLGAWWQTVGTTGHTRMWPLEAKLDAGLVVAFGYKLTDDGIRPLPMSEVEDLGDELIPSEGLLRSFKFTAGDDGSQYVCIGPCRYIVLVELVLCKERPDFVPGELTGFARIHPHAFVWANEDLARVEIGVTLERPVHPMACGAKEGMKDTIGLLAVADANDEHSLSGKFGTPVPWTDALYDYYECEPFTKIGARKLVHDADDPADPKKNDHPLQRKGEVTMADARFKQERMVDAKIKRLTPWLYNNDPEIRKCKRQGQFDSIHMAARMKAEFLTLSTFPPSTMVLDDIVMINTCLHDCVHMHVRWGEFLADQPILRGWGPGGPHTRMGVPSVPPNQSVFVSFPDKHSLVYRAVAENCRAGEAQVICHHGMAYAVDTWPGIAAAGLTQLMLETIHGEAERVLDPYIYEFPTRWLEFYWRVRYTRHNGKIVERLTFNLEKCLR